MKKKSLYLKGLRTPRFLIFLRGFVDGRSKTAAVDSESKFLCSGYLEEKLFLFSELCDRRVIALEDGLSPDRSEASSLLMELSLLPAPTAGGESAPAAARAVPGTPPATVPEAQACRAAARSAARAAEAAERSRKRREETEARRQAILQRLVEIQDRIATRELIAGEELSATAEALKGLLCAYAHGVLLRPVQARYLRPIEYAPRFDAYRQSHDALDRKLTRALQ